MKALLGTIRSQLTGSWCWKGDGKSIIISVGQSGNRITAR
jgi:hypothetical protein